MQNILIVLAVFLSIGSVTASKRSDARPENTLWQNAVEIPNSGRFSPPSAHARHRALNSISSAHHARNHLSDLDDHNATLSFENPFGVVKGREVLGRVSLISDRVILAHISYDSSAVDISMKNATTFKLAYLDFPQVSHDDSLANIRFSEGRSRPACLTLLWSTPTLTLEDCYSRIQMRRAAASNKTQIYHVDRSSGFIVPVSYCASDDTPLNIEGAEQAEIAIIDGPVESSAASPVDTFSPPGSSPAPFTSITTPEYPSASSSTCCSQTGSEKVSVSDSCSGGFSPIPTCEFLYVYPWRFDQSDEE